MKGRTFKVCSTCINFEIIQTQKENNYRCKRLGYETKPFYSFTCWDPKPRVKELIEKLAREGRLKD